MRCFVLMIVLCVATVSAQEQETETDLRHSSAMTVLQNHHRRQAGLREQRIDATLSRHAQQWAENMARRGSMYHGPHDQVIAYSSSQDYAEGFRLWLGSSPHRAWLYSDCDLCGFGYAVSSSGVAYFAGAFGSSAEATATPSPSATRASFGVTYYPTGHRRGLFRRRG